MGEYTVVAEVSLAKVNPDANPERIALNTILMMMVMMLGQEVWRATRPGDGRRAAQGLTGA